MSVPAIASDDLHDAAEIAAAFLRFIEKAAHPFPGHTPKGDPVLGRDVYHFVPGPRVLRDKVADYLAMLPGPAILAPTTTRGMIAVMLVAELSGQRRVSAQHSMTNQSASLPGIDQAPDSARVLLEFDGETHLFSMGAVRLWAERFGILVGWNVGPHAEPERAEWRFMLFGYHDDKAR